MINVFINGQAGTTGLQLKERLLKHPMVNLIEIENEKRKDNSEIKKCIDKSDVVFLCLPDDAARESMSLVTNPKTVVIDASTAHRTADGWDYGFPELSDEMFQNIKKSKRIANPGCHATGFISVVYPLIQMGVMPKDYPLSAHSITGYSGGGNKMIAAYENSNRPDEYDSPRQYGLSQSHKHLPEMKKITGIAEAPVFNPIVGDFYCGMAVSVPIHTKLLSKKMTANEITKLYKTFYEKSAFINVLSAPDDGFLSANTLVGTNKLNIYVMGNDERITVTSVFDNLGKGASGAAVENMNIAMGFPETMAL